MRALTLWQPWASLCVIGVKTIETRSWPAPKALIGQRIAIHAAKRRVRWPHRFTPDVLTFGNAGAAWLDVAGSTIDLPLGAVVGTAVLTDCLPMVDPIPIGEHATSERVLQIGPIEGGMAIIDRWVGGGQTVAVVSDQLPFGDFRPGRWAWLLADAEPCEPVPAVGRQGVWRWEP